jgi:hypothetical protein
MHKLAIALLTTLALLILAPPVNAQTGISVETGTAAMVAHQNGQTAAANLSWVIVPVYNSSPDVSGYTNTCGIRSDAFVPASPFAWGYYGAGVDCTPTKWLNKLGGKLLVPTDSIHLEFNGTVGAYNPNIGNSHVAGMVGGTVAWALNSSGTITWNALGCDYMLGVSPAAWGCTTGVSFGPFGGNNAQSAKSIKANRAMYAIKHAVKR